MGWTEALMVAAVLAAVLAAAAALWMAARRGRGGEVVAQSLAASFQSALAELGQRVGALSAEVQGILRQQEALRADLGAAQAEGRQQVHAAAEALTERVQQAHLALAGLAELAQQGVQTQGTIQQALAGAERSLAAEIGRTRELLARLQEADQARAASQQEAFEALYRLENLLAGAKARGSAGENILEQALLLLPPPLRETNLRINNKPVEFALNLPGGRVLPIDSKWPALPALEQLAAASDPAERRRLADQVERELLRKVDEVTKYLDPDRTIGLGLVAVPEAVYALCGRAHAEAYRRGVIIVSYAHALPVVLFLLQLVHRFAATVDAAQLSAALKTVDEALARLEDEVEGRLSKSLVQLQNSQAELRAQVGRARQGVAALERRAEPSLPPPAD